jgi:hypothetical protein
MTFAEKNAFRVDVAREFAVATHEFLQISTVAQAAFARFEQARAYLTYMDNIEFSMDIQ